MRAEMSDYGQVGVNYTIDEIAPVCGEFKRAKEMFLEVSKTKQRPLRLTYPSLHVGHFVLPAKAPHKRLALPARARKRSDTSAVEEALFQTALPQVDQ